jgi:hypothetical protein
MVQEEGGATGAQNSKRPKGVPKKEVDMVALREVVTQTMEKEAANKKANAKKTASPKKESSKKTAPKKKARK